MVLRSSEMAGQPMGLKGQEAVMVVREQPEIARGERSLQPEETQRHYRT